MIFRRSELTHPLVQPERGGTLDGLRELINLPEEDYRLAIGWVVAAYLTGIPHPILLVQGEQGTAKSGLIRTLLALVDPQPAAERTPPKDQREWAIFARASWAFSYDNITDIPPWLSNALCKGVTGDAVLQRVLHSDDDIGVYSFQRVIALTTIAIRPRAGRRPRRPDPAHRTRGDRGRRARGRRPAPPAPPRCPARSAPSWTWWPACSPSCPHTTVENAPRMADFAKVLAALDAVTGWGTLASYRAKVATPGAVPDRGQHLRPRPLPARHRPQPRRTRPGARGKAPPPNCSPPCGGICTDARMAAADLPAGDAPLGQQVREIAPALRKAGVDIRPGKRTEHRRPLIISKTAPASDQAHTLSSLLKRTDVMLSAGPVHRRSMA